MKACVEIALIERQLRPWRSLIVPRRIWKFHSPNLIDETVAILGVSLLVLGFGTFLSTFMQAISPLLWGLVSEVIGRRYLFVCTYAPDTASFAGAAGSQNIDTL